MKKILYLSCHCVLEYDELRILNDLGYDVFTNDAYHRPRTPVVNRRPPVDIPDKPDYLKLFYDMCHTNSLNPNVKPEQYNNLLTDEIIDAFDIFIIMHLPRFVEENWEKLKAKNKTVIWRTIGQSTPDVEAKMLRYREDGMKIVRYSPKERELAHYAGEDTIIRFAKYESDYLPYVGDQNYVMTFGQNVIGRGDHCRYDLIRNVSKDFNFKLFGPGNAEAPMAYGEVDYSTQLLELSKNKAYLYSGTWPASYTLNFMEAWMSGIPVVALGTELASKVGPFPYEVSELIKHGETGFCSNNIKELKECIREVMIDATLRQRISENGRKAAAAVFGAESIKAQWKAFIDNV